MNENTLQPSPEVVEAFERVKKAVAGLVKAIMEAIKPLVDWIVNNIKKIWGAIVSGLVPGKWLHLAKHAKKARTRKKYRNRIRRAVFAALAAEGGGSS